MSLYSALVNAENNDRPEALPGFSKLTVSEAEKSVTGNLCRCTGYCPIADVCKSFASDVDLEDLGTFSFWKKGDTKEVRAKRLPSYNPKNHACPVLLEEEYKSMKVLNSKKFGVEFSATWSISKVIEYLKENSKSSSGSDGGLVFVKIAELIIWRTNSSEIRVVWVGI